MQLTSRVRAFLGRTVDFKMGTAGAFVMGGVVYGVNIEHGPLGAGTAALKQAAYTFLFGGAIARMCQHLATAPARAALAWAVLLPSSTAVAATWLLHQLRGTPEPGLSTLPTLLLAPPSFLVLGAVERRRARK